MNSFNLVFYATITTKSLNAHLYFTSQISERFFRNKITVKKELGKLEKKDAITGVSL